MSAAKPEREGDIPRADVDWDGWRKYWEDAGVLVPARTKGVVTDLDSLGFLPFTEDEVSRMFLRLRRSGKL